MAIRRGDVHTARRRCAGCGCQEEGAGGQPGGCRTIEDTSSAALTISSALKRRSLPTTRQRARGAWSCYGSNPPAPCRRGLAAHLADLAHRSICAHLAAQQKDPAFARGTSAFVKG